MNKFTFHNFKSKKKGFTLVELLVSVAMFTLVMFMATSAVFSIIEANRKSHTLKSVMTNLNFALESIMRDVRVGSRYSCDGGGDCPNSPGTVFAYKANRDVDEDGIYDLTNNFDQIEYSLDSGRIKKRIFGKPAYPITAEEIVITKLNFYVIGSGTLPGDARQPKVVIVIEGYSGEGNTRSDFSIQTTVSQRQIDS
jgi:prepilin-type N-terminal cleavage/methylation domain-containing protein